VTGNDNRQALFARRKLAATIADQPERALLEGGD
jgi:hypothetical protein